VIAGVMLAACRPASDTRAPLPSEPVRNEPSSAASLRSPLAAPGSAAIDKGLIRTVVRTHVGELRSCYEQGLATDPALSGRVSVRFTIDPRGNVSKAAVASSNLPAPTEPVHTCIVAAVKTWRFPVPMGSKEAVVLYPFVLAPGRRVTSPSGSIAGEQVDGRWAPVDGLAADVALVEVIDAQHRPVAGAKVILALAIGAASEEREAITDATGRAMFEELPSGATAIAMVEPNVRTESTVVGSGAVGVIVLIDGGS